MRVRVVVFNAAGEITWAHKHGDHSVPCQCELPVEPGGRLVFLPGIADGDDQEAERWHAFTRPDSLLRGGWTPESVAAAFGAEEPVHTVPNLGELEEGYMRRVSPGPRAIVDVPHPKTVEAFHMGELHGASRGLMARAPRPQTVLRHILPGSPLLAPFTERELKEKVNE